MSILAFQNQWGRDEFETVKELDDEKFRRLAGVKRTMFDKMVLILEQSSKDKKINGGRKNKLSIENMLLMTLEYIWEYRTYFHISQSYGVSESTAYKTVRWIEDTLIKHPDFALPGRKALLKSDIEYEVVLIDATETPIERPKKSKSTFIQGRRKSIL
ncbi:MAG: IS5 family transposase ISCaa2 [Chlamydiales bacterium]|nr:IS5 family transposase ISCaa2 [Chlamydiales bacterium]